MIRWHESFNTGDVAFVLVATLVQLVLVCPALIALYSGFSARRDLREVCRQFPLVMAALSLAWSLWAYSLAFAPSPGSVPAKGDEVAAVQSSFQEMTTVQEARKDETHLHGRGGFVGGMSYFNQERHLPMAGSDHPHFPSRRPFHTIPSLLFLSLHMMLFVAAPVPLLLLWLPQMRPALLLPIAVAWGTVIYAPLAHWNWGDGWLEIRGFLDCSGGLLHAGVGFSALACLLITPKRSSSTATTPSAATTAVADEDLPPSPLIADLGVIAFWGGTVLVQSALLFHLDGRTVIAFLNSHLAASAGALMWVVISKWIWDQNDRFGFCAGAVSGLVAISPGCAYMLPQSALITGGLIAACSCSIFQLLKGQFPEGPGLRIFVMQGVSAVGGCLMCGLFATSSVAGFRWDQRLIAGAVEGNVDQLGIQAIGMLAAVIWAFFGTIVLLGLVKCIRTNPVA